jgi:hypothetical protein
MTTDQNEQSISDRDQVLRRLKNRRDFQAHLVGFAVINGAVWVVWVAAGGGYPWPTGVWGMGLLLNAWEACFRRPITEGDVQRELRHLHAGR